MDFKSKKTVLQDPRDKVFFELSRFFSSFPYFVIKDRHMCIGGVRRLHSFSDLIWIKRTQTWKKFCVCVFEKISVLNLAAPPQPNTLFEPEHSASSFN